MPIDVRHRILKMIEKKNMKKGRGDWNHLHPYIERCRIYMSLKEKANNSNQIKNFFENTNGEQFNKAVRRLLLIKEWIRNDHGLLVPNLNYINNVNIGCKNVAHILKNKEWISLERSKMRDAKLFNKIYKSKNLTKLMEAHFADVKANPKILDVYIKYHLKKRMLTDGVKNAKDYAKLMLNKAAKCEINPFLPQTGKYKKIRDYLKNHSLIDYFDPSSKSGEESFLRFLQKRIFVSGFEETDKIIDEILGLKVSKSCKDSKWRI